MNKKVKKFISKSLLVSILLASMSTNSLAGILSEDIRYEIFEGNNIKVDNILEDDMIDVEIEGNTLINIIDYNKKPDMSNIWNWNYHSGDIKVSQSTGNFDGIHYKTIKPLETNKQYTLFVNITKNTMINNSSNSNSVIKIAVAKDYGDNNVIYIQNNQTGIVKYLYTVQEIDIVTPYISSLPNSVGEFAFEDLMILEGNHLNKDINFFEGMKSVGQNDKNGHNIEVFSGNKNLCPNNNHKQTFNVNELTNYQNGSIIVKNIKVKPNTTYYISCSDFKSGLNHIECITSNKPIDAQNHVDAYYKRVRELHVLNGIITTLSNEEYITLTTGNWLTTEDTKTFYIKELQVEEASIGTVYTPYIIDRKEILLKEPLRGLPNGVKDKIIKKNGKWYIERNCYEIVLDENINASPGGNTNSDRVELYILPNNLIPRGTSTSNDSSYMGASINGNIPAPSIGKNVATNMNQWCFLNGLGGISIAMPVDIIGGNSVSDLKNWLSKNPVTIIYQMAEPIYEPLTIDSTVELYLDTTHISINSTIPANLKIKIDRVANRAKEYVEVAKLNPSTENISIARMWTNLMKESILKDQFQDEINNILQIEDLEIEKKKASANLDLYIKTKNTLSLSLDTNSVTFDSYSGVEDIELLSAVNLTVNSSLPYSLNAYIEEGFYNSDKTNSLEVNSLNIRENTESMYKQFTNIKEKVVLKDNCDEGNEKYHTIDLKLNGNNAHKTDVYKTVLKFEAEQK